MASKQCQILLGLAAPSRMLLHAQGFAHKHASLSLWWKWKVNSMIACLLSACK